MKKIVKNLLNSTGYRLSRAGETMVVPVPQPGPEVYGCEGIDWGAGRVAEFMAGPLSAYREEYASFPARPAGPRSYFYDNMFYGLADAAVCYSFVRDRRPSVVVEVGSGMSSRVIRAALDRNGAGRLISIDPNPRAPVDGVSHEYIQSRVQGVARELFTSLPADALLFIDSSHMAGTGSDVNYLFLEVLPALRPGALVHVHDIYLPSDYPTSWNIGRRRNYSEQYLLHALLCFSHGFRVLWPGRWVLANMRAELGRLMPEGADLERHCSFWMERTGASGPNGRG